MPNGGSDCCGTCWFNAKNRPETPPHQAVSSVPAHCSLRDLEIPDPYYTYCANHPHRCPQADSIPIGPVFVGDADGSREVWQPSPDNEQVRKHLLDLLAAIPQEPASEYPIGAYRDEVVVWQLGEFGEARAIIGLQRVAKFSAESAESGLFGRTRH